MAFGLNLGNLVVHLVGDIRQYERMMGRAEAIAKRTSQKMGALGRSLALGLTAPLTLIGGLAVKSFASFDDAMTKSLAIMGNVSADMRAEMEKMARSISRNSVTSATDAAKAFFFLASAGLDAKQSVAALAVVERFSVAGAFDMAEATDLLTDAQSALGLSVKDVVKNQKNMIRISDVLVKANTLANASVRQFSVSLTTRAAASLRNLNKDVEEGVAVLAAFADQGIKGQRAGTALAIVLRDVQTATLKNEKAWKKFGISLFDANDNVKNIADLLKDLEGLFDGMTDKQKKMTAAALGFRDKSFGFIQSLIGTSKQIKRYEQELRKAGDTTRRVADKQLKSFSSQMKILGNNVRDVGIEIGQMLVPGIQRMSKAVRKALELWRSLSKETKGYIIIAAKIAAALGPGLLILSKLLAVMAPIIAAMKLFGIVVLKALAIFKIAGLVAILLPFIKVVAVIGLVAAAVLGLIRLIAGKEGLAAIWGFATMKMEMFFGRGRTLIENFKVLWFTVLEVVRGFFQKVRGFIANFGENMGLLLRFLITNWVNFVENVTVLLVFLRDNWKNILKDMFNIALVFIKNSLFNWVVMFKTLVRLALVFSGFMFRWSVRLLEMFITLVSKIPKLWRMALRFMVTSLIAVLKTIVNVWIAMIRFVIRVLGRGLRIILSLWSTLRNFLIKLFISIWRGDFVGTLIRGLRDAAKFIVKWAKKLASLNIIEAILKGREIVLDIIQDFGKDAAKDFKKGFESEDIAKTMGDIIKEGLKEIRAPLEGFESSLEAFPKVDFGITALPDFNFDLIQRGTEKIMQKAKTGVENMEDSLSGIPPIQLGIVAGYEKIRKAIVGVEMPAARAAPTLAAGAFREVSLRRFALEGPAVGGARKKVTQKVEDPGVANRLDVLIDIAKKGAIAVLG